MANTKISSLTASVSNLSNTDLFPVVETSGVGPVAKTGAQIALGVLNNVAGFTYNTTGNTLTVNGSFVSTKNTFTLGTSNVGTNNYTSGYSYMPNGIKMQWGFVAAVNSTANVVTLPSAFTNIFSVSATSTLTASHVAVTDSSTSTITITANTTTNTGVYWTAIGK